MATDLGAGSHVGAYVLEEKLGGGSFGSVWRANDPATGDVVAIKLLNGTQATGDRSAIRAEVELLAATASSRSAHVVRVLDGGAEPIPYIVMEYVAGTDLAALLLERGTLPPNEAVDVGLAVADALQALYGAGIIHRDIKPANVLIDRNHVVKLADFGIAKIVGLETITMTGQLPMTMAYAAPEAWEGNASHQSDLYSMGVVLYQCLAGSPPFSGNYGALYKAHTSMAPDLDRLPLETPPSLRELIRACLEKDAAARPDDAAACLVLLQRAAGELTAPPTPEPMRFGPWIRRGPHPTQPWAWRCVHEESGETATVEVHAFAEVSESTRLRAAVDANAALVPQGAERLLGMNRLVLRPDEAWREAPDGAFQFWVARHEAPPAPPSSEISVPRLRRAVDALAALLATAATANVALSLDAPNVTMLADASVHVRRPGLAPVIGDPEDEAMAYLRGLPLDEDAAAIVARVAGLEDLRAQLTGPSVAGMALGVAAAHDERAMAGASGDTTMIGRANVVAGGVGPLRYEPPPAPPVRIASGGGSDGGLPPARRGPFASFGDLPWHYRLAGIGGSAVLAVAVVGMGIFFWGQRPDNASGAPNVRAQTTSTATRTTTTPTPNGTSTPDVAKTWVYCATEVARAGGGDPGCAAALAQTPQPSSAVLGIASTAAPTLPPAQAPDPRPTLGSTDPPTPVVYPSATLQPAATPVTRTDTPVPPPTRTPTPPVPPPPPPTTTTPPPPPPKFGDINLDGRVDCVDVAAVTGDWLKSGSPADLNRDGVVGAADLALVLTNLDPGVVCGHSADINRDRIVNSRDLLILIGDSSSASTPTPTPIPGAQANSCWQYYNTEGHTVEPSNPCDVNGDGMITSADLAIILSRWGTSPPIVP